MNPVIALIGRPNVGKSTLFNRLTRSRDALVSDYPGLTRDRKYGHGKFDERGYIVIDTGGISDDGTGIDQVVTKQALLALTEADAVLFLVDAKAGLTPVDESIADHLRRTNKPAWLVVNKTDGIDENIAIADFFALGLSDRLWPIAAAHGRGISQLIQHVLHQLTSLTDSASEEMLTGRIRIGVVGRPNVGKSTLINSLLGEERVIVFNQSGTTRDSIYIPYERHEQSYTLIDTAGVRRRKNVRNTVEKYSIIKTLQAIRDAHVVVLLIDACEGLTDQDMHLLGFIINAGRALVIAINKWDGIHTNARNKIKHQLEMRLGFARFARIHFISALHGSGINRLYASIDEAYECTFTKWSTNKLTCLLQDCIAQHAPPLVHGRRIKLRYAHLGGSNPPLFIVHGSQTHALPMAYKRFLENQFIKYLNIKGSPVRFEFRSNENPYENKNHLTRRQRHKKQRMMKYVSKVKKKAKHH
jgi:GTP-binding protein